MQSRGNPATRDTEPSNTSTGHAGERAGATCGERWAAQYCTEAAKLRIPQCVSVGKVPRLTLPVEEEVCGGRGKRRGDDRRRLTIFLWLARCKATQALTSRTHILIARRLAGHYFYLV